MSRGYPSVGQWGEEKGKFYISGLFKAFEKKKEKMKWFHTRDLLNLLSTGSLLDMKSTLSTGRT